MAEHKKSHRPEVQSAETRLHYHRPDFDVAYAILAPLVTEALARCEHGDYRQGVGALRQAKAVIDAAVITAMTVEVPCSE